MRIVLALLLLVPALVIAGEVHFNVGPRYEVGDGRERNEVDATLEVEYLFDAAGRIGLLVGSTVSDREAYAAVTTGLRQGALRSYLGLGYGVVKTNPGYEIFAPRAISATETVMVATPALVPRRDTGGIVLLGSEWSLNDRFALGARYTLGKTDKYHIERSTAALYLSATFR